MIRAMAEAADFDVLGLGTVVVDHLAVLEAHPPQDTKHAVVRDHFQVGGPVPTALAALTRLGRRCGFGGLWGEDPFGHMIEADLDREGIDRTWSERVAEERSGFAHVWVCGETASRTIAYHRPSRGIGAAQLAAMPIERARAIHLDGWPAEAALAAAKRARAAGVLVALDAGSPKEGMAELLKHVDVLNVPRRFLAGFFEADDIDSGLDRLEAFRPQWITVTDGQHGATLAHGGARLHHAAPAVEAIDTTGAGDVFSGALLHGVLAGETPGRVLQIAVTAASLKCQAIGNRDALPTLAQIEARLCTSPSITSAR
jgi:sugar/nucleoside kinase (ribokinase family)